MILKNIPTFSLRHFMPQALCREGEHRPPVQISDGPASARERNHPKVCQSIGLFSLQHHF